MPTEFQQIAIEPRVAGLGYTHLLPAGWQRLPIPEEVPDFAEPVFMPLGAFMAPYGAVLMTVGARPAFSDGSVYEWLRYLCEREQFEIRSLMPARIGELDAIVSDCIQQSDAGPMTIRMILIEDGGRLVAISAIAPSPLWEPLEPMFASMIESFRLMEPRGATVPLVPAGASA
jgi:hypothetical protein